MRKIGNSSTTLKMIQKTFDDRPSPHGDEADLLDRYVVAFNTVILRCLHMSLSFVLFL